MKSSITIIVAYTNNLLIGKDNSIPWHISDDLKRFKKLTTGNVIIMGRKTFESLGSKPLPNRTNIVISSKINTSNSVKVYKNLIEAINDHRNEKIFLIGGYSIYKEGLNFASHLEITEIDSIQEGDTYFPNIDWNKWKISNIEEHFDKKLNAKYFFKSAVRN